MRRRSIPFVAVLLFGGACSADPTTAAGALAAPKKPSATAPEAMPSKSATPTTTAPVVSPSAAFHKAHAVTPADFAKLAPASPGTKIDRAHVAPGATPTVDPGENAKGGAVGDEGSPSAPKSGEPE